MKRDLLSITVVVIFAAAILVSYYIFVPSRKATVVNIQPAAAQLTPISAQPKPKQPEAKRVRMVHSIDSSLGTSVPVQTATQQSR